MSLDEMAAKVFGLSSFTTVGHLIHINLKGHLLQQKHEIGACLLKQNPRALAVVNKVNNIQNDYRNFEIEVIAKREGSMDDEKIMIVEVKENKCRFQLDFSKVFWNSRLSTEHERIIGKLNNNHDIVFDLFAGVGPFSVPAARARCKTYANDLNPDSVYWLRINMERNKAPKQMYEIYNTDAKDFILTTMKQKLLHEYQLFEEEQSAIKPTIHIIMNLPELAKTFLPHFVGLFKSDLVNEQDNLLMNRFREQSINHFIYCYCFLKGKFDDPKAEVRQMIEEHMGRKFSPEQLVEIFRVRNVAPFKDMYRVQLKLDEQILNDEKATVSIMKTPKNRLSRSTMNGTPKKVTIHAPNGKRSHEGVDETSSDDSPDDCSSKKAKTSLCSIM